MHCVKLLIDEHEGGNPCFGLLPKEVNDPCSGVTGEVLQCTCLAMGGGCAMIHVTDRHGVLSEKITDRLHISNENGECMIDRVSKHQLVAMVMNNNCQLSQIISESGCLITSAVIENNRQICWTIVGPNSTILHSLIERLNTEGFTTTKKSSFLPVYSKSMTDKQEHALQTAFEHGFYEIPRKINMEELCGIVGCSKSTLNVMLRTAEKKLISQYLMENRKFTVGTGK